MQSCARAPPEGQVDASTMSDPTDRLLDFTLVEAVVELIPDPVIGVDRGGTICVANQLATELFGYDSSDLVGGKLERLVPDRARLQHRRHREGFEREPSVRQMGAGLDLHGRRKDGTEFPVDISLAPIATESGPLVVAADRDLTERRREPAAPAHLAALVESTDPAGAAPDRPPRERQEGKAGVA